MPFTGPVEDRLAIRELYGTYADASWRGDKALWLATFAEDGRWTSHLFDAAGHEALGATWDGLWKDWASVAFLSELGSIEVEDDSARVRSFAREVVQTKAGAVFKLCGRYDDALVRVEGTWKFARRDYTLTIPEFPE
ncbi:nuclear transport factor 2 family protein [Novosphingobium soli]|uniref:Nuclear transport factor 2 family protein n=1 Tax=Novosphingobium soli TaxID=574956 RepID=A0ABV6D176_9SPHN